jgi:AraC-like DNA-binding protein
LRRRLAGVPRTERVEAALATLRAARGRLTVRALREATGASERWLERAFRREVGLPPRTLAAVLRVQAALMLRSSEPSWARLAAELGYFDQPHLSREFRRHAGLPPAALLEALGPLARAFLPEHVQGAVMPGEIGSEGSGQTTARGRSVATPRSSFDPLLTVET